MLSHYYCETKIITYHIKQCNYHNLYWYLKFTTTIILYFYNNI